MKLEIQTDGKFRYILILHVSCKIWIRGRDVPQWYSTCLAIMRAWILSQTSPTSLCVWYLASSQQKKKLKHKSGHMIDVCQCCRVLGRCCQVRLRLLLADFGPAPRCHAQPKGMRMKLASLADTRGVALHAHCNSAEGCVCLLCEKPTSHKNLPFSGRLGLMRGLL